jgi:hypothetical protein
MAEKTKWIVVNLPITQVIKLKEEKPYLLVNLFKGIATNGKVVDRATLGVNGISTIFSRKLLAKKQQTPETHYTFVFPSTFNFRLLETKFNDTTRVYEDVREYQVSAEELASLI